MRLTDRDQEILSSLCTKVRLFTAQQIADCWWRDASTSLATARQRMGKLVASEFVAQLRVLAAPLPLLHSPVIAWAPGDEAPDYGAAAWQLQSRWKEPVELTRVYLATNKACRLFGGKRQGSLKAEYQATHDLGVSQMYIQRRIKSEQAIANWIGEDVLAHYRKGQKLPDAVLAPAPGENPSLVLEFGGAYDKRRVEAFHKDCAKRELAYEVW